MSERQVEIAIDAMGGENSPYKVLKGTEIFLKNEKKTKVIFFGVEKLINDTIKKTVDIKRLSIQISTVLSEPILSSYLPRIKHPMIPEKLIKTPRKRI